MRILKSPPGILMKPFRKHGIYPWNILKQKPAKMSGRLRRRNFWKEWTILTKIKQHEKEKFRNRKKETGVNGS